MLSDEERKAINHLTEKMKYHKDNPLGTYVWLTLDEHYVRTILNLIEKQSKEIEEIKRNKNFLEKQEIEYIRDRTEDEINYRWENKIKAEIEESELLIDNSQGCMSDEDLYKEYGKIEFGKSLLEKE